MTPKKNFLGIAATTRSDRGQKAIFLKKMHFSGRKWHFSKNSFYSKFIIDQKYIIYIFKKKKIY